MWFDEQLESGKARPRGLWFALRSRVYVVPRRRPPRSRVLVRSISSLARRVFARHGRPHARCCGHHGCDQLEHFLNRACFHLRGPVRLHRAHRRLLARSRVLPAAEPVLRFARQRALPLVHLGRAAYSGGVHRLSRARRAGQGRLGRARRPLPRHEGLPRLHRALGARGEDAHRVGAVGAVEPSRARGR